MNQTYMVHYAVACLEGLSLPMTPRELSRTQSVPFEDCLLILRQFEAAGLVRKNAQGSFERTCSMEQLTALEVLQALWQTSASPAFRMLYGPKHIDSTQVIRRSVKAVGRANG